MLDLTKSAKRFMAINLIDDKSLMLRMPTKRVFNALVGLQTRLPEFKSNDIGMIDEMYELLSVIMSNNLNHEEISVEYLSKIIDIEDLQTIYQEYMKFVKGVSDDPNSKSPQSQENSQI